MPPSCVQSVALWSPERGNRLDHSEALLCWVSYASHTFFLLGGISLINLHMICGSGGFGDEPSEQAVNRSVAYSWDAYWLCRIIDRHVNGRSSISGAQNESSVPLRARPLISNEDDSLCEGSKSLLLFIKAKRITSCCDEPDDETGWASHSKQFKHLRTKRYFIKKGHENKGKIDKI